MCPKAPSGRFSSRCLVNSVGRLALAAALVAWAVPLAAQQSIDYASVSGRVSDSSGAVVVGARVTATARQGRRFWNMRVRFKARVAVTDGTAAYNVRIFPPSSKRGRSTTAVIQRNVRAGEEVEQVFQHLNGGGEYRIVVSYHRETEPGQEAKKLSKEELVEDIGSGDEDELRMISL